MIYIKDLQYGIYTLEESVIMQLWYSCTGVCVSSFYIIPLLVIITKHNILFSRLYFITVNGEIICKLVQHGTCTSVRNLHMDCKMSRIQLMWYVTSAKLVYYFMHVVIAYMCTQFTLSWSIAALLPENQQLYQLERAWLPHNILQLQMCTFHQCFCVALTSITGLILDFIICATQIQYRSVFPNKVEHDYMCVKVGHTFHTIVLYILKYMVRWIDYIIIFHVKMY